MDKRTRVLLYGKSVILGTVSASLQRHPEFEILPAASPLLDMRELRALSPDVIFYDIEASHPEAAIALLEICPDLLLIGINPDSNQVFLWSGQQLCELSMADLVNVIRMDEIRKEQTDSEISSEGTHKNNERRRTE